MTLPDCSLYLDDVTSDDLLDAVDRAALVRALAEHGLEGARALLRDQAAHDQELKDRLDRLRERLRRQANRRVTRLLQEYDRRAEELAEVSRKSDAEVAEQIAALEARLRSARSVDWSRHRARRDWQLHSGPP